MFYKNNVSVINKNVLILGCGGTSKTAEFVSKKLGARNVNRVYCKGVKDILDIDGIDVINTNIIINTTPNGMLPHCGDNVFLNFNTFNRLEYYIDVIYNPLRNKSVIIANNNGVKAIGGLYMLITQGYFANDIYE